MPGFAEHDVRTALRATQRDRRARTPLVLRDPGLVTCLAGLRSLSVGGERR